MIALIFQRSFLNSPNSNEISKSTDKILLKFSFSFLIYKIYKITNFVDFITRNSFLLNSLSLYSRLIFELFFQKIRKFVSMTPHSSI